MAQSEIQLRDDLSHLLQEMDAVLLQRATDYVRGLIDASNEQQTDWWNELPQSVKDSYELGMKDIEEGNMISVEDMLKKYES